MGRQAIGGGVDDSIERWTLVEPGVAEGKWEAYITAAKRELLLHEKKLNYQAPTMHRYRLP